MKKIAILNLEGNDYKVQFTLNSMRMLEKTYGVKIEQLGDNFDLEKVQALLHVGLVKHTPELTFDAVGDMVDMSNIQEVVNVLTEALGGLQK